MFFKKSQEFQNINEKDANKHFNKQVKIQTNLKEEDLSFEEILEKEKKFGFF